MAKKIDKEEFLKRSIEKYGDMYDYSNVNYVDFSTAITIICKKHGEFLQVPSHHIKAGKSFGCPKCGLENKKRNLTLDEFITRSKEVHGDFYDYSQVDYIKNSIHVKIICPIHGEFSQAPAVHLRGSICPKCSREKLKTIKISEKVNDNLVERISIINNPTKTFSEKVVGSIYMFHNIINGKLYIGKTVDSYSSRISKHKSNAFELNLENYFYKAIRKYGWDNFEKYIIFQTETLENTPENKIKLDEIVCQKEREYIAEFKANNPTFGYNLTDGGDGICGFKFSKESRERMSNRVSGENHPNFGKRGLRGIKLLQYSLSGEFIAEYPNATIAGETLSVHKSSVGKASIKGGTCANSIWIKESEFSIDEINRRIANYFDSINSKKVLQFSLSGEFIKEYPSASEAAREFNCNSSTIGKAASCDLKSGSFQAKGFLWIYKNEYSPEIILNKVNFYKNLKNNY